MAKTGTNKLLKASKEKKHLASTIVTLLLTALMVFFLIRLTAPGEADLTMNGMNITLPEGYVNTYYTSVESSWNYKGPDEGIAPLHFDARVHGDVAQLFGTAEEVIDSCDWLTDMEIYVNPNGVRMARGYNFTDPEKPELRYYVEGDPVVFQILISENPKYYDAEACEKKIREVADSITPGKQLLLSQEELLNKLAKSTPEQLADQLTVHQKAYQMVQEAPYNVTQLDMRQNCYGSILSQRSAYSRAYWVEMTDGYQRNALASEAGIPYIYGNDDVHGVNYCLNAVIFPHNIGIGAADDVELTREMGKAVADEALMCHMPWNFAPCVAHSVDLRWGRTYESYGADLDRIARLGGAYIEGLTAGGAIACAKHFFGDGDVTYGTGEDFRRIDRGDASLSDEETEAEMAVYRHLIESGAQTVMVSYSSLNGTKMHENTEYLQRLKEETNFDGFFVGDWDAVRSLPGMDYREKVIRTINAGVDMLMEVDYADEVAMIITEAVEKGEISEARINDAVTRILRVKQKAGLLTDPYFSGYRSAQEDVGSPAYREIAEQLVEKSLVLLKNEDALLPLRSGTTVWVTGPAADNAQAQCGGWTLDWNGAQADTIPGVTTIAEGLKTVCAEHGIRVVTDPAEGEQADLVILCVGEKPYAEWYGDTPDPSLYGPHGLTGNRETVEAVRELGKPTVTLIVAGRQVLLEDEDLDGWDSAVMCYLPGSEGSGIARVLCGEKPFTGRLPSPWYHNVEEIRTDNSRWPMGYGLTTGTN